MKRQKRISAGIIGKNFGLKVLSKALIKTKRFDLKAISFQSKKFDKNLIKRSSFFSNWRDLIKDKDIKAVIIATPPVMHEKIINFAIQHKKHIFCEKPCTISSEKVNKIIKKIKSKNFFISHIVNYELSEIESFKYFKNLIKKDKLKIKSIEIEWNIFNRSKLKSWKNFHSKGGGLIFNYYCHTLHYVESLFGKITSTNCLTKFNLHKRNDIIKVLLKLKNSISCSVEINSSKYLAKNKLFHKLTIFTNKGKFIIKSNTVNISDGFSINKYYSSKDKLVKRKIFYDKSNTDFRIFPSFINFKKFADSIKEKKIISPNLDEAKNIHFLINRTIQSSKKNKELLSINKKKR
jgi:predicted dehydrogenase